MTTRETAWLIESRFQPRPTWWTGGNNPAPWTRDSLQAVWFCRKQDATAAMVTLPEGHMCFISEHTWELGVEDAEIEALRARVSDLERERAYFEEAGIEAQRERDGLKERVGALEKALRLHMVFHGHTDASPCTCEACTLGLAALQGTEPAYRLPAGSLPTVERLVREANEKLAQGTEPKPEEGKS
jgi:hypothetical protein